MTETNTPLENQADSDKEKLPAFKSYSYKTRGIIFVANLAIFTLFDQWTKYWAFHNLKGELPRSYFMGLFQLRYAENTGAWGNLGGNWPEPMRSIFLIGFPILILLLVAGFMLTQKYSHKLETWAYALIVTGGFGNLIDRIRLNYVIDFMYAGTHKSIPLWGSVRIPLETNIFNIADVIIMIGAGLILLRLILEHFQKTQEAV